jgi:hypothetical protein
VQTALEPDLCWNGFGLNSPLEVFSAEQLPPCPDSWLYGWHEGALNNIPDEPYSELSWLDGVVAEERPGESLGDRPEVIYEPVPAVSTTAEEETMFCFLKMFATESLPLHWSSSQSPLYLGMHIDSSFPNPPPSFSPSQPSPQSDSTGALEIDTNHGQTSLPRSTPSHTDSDSTGSSMQRPLRVATRRRLPQDSSGAM